MRISPSYSDDDWKKLDFHDEVDWKTATEIFVDRINGRFLKPVELIHDYKYVGFVSMAIDCLLIETLQQFIEGKSFTPRGEGKRYFVKFLTNYCADFFTEYTAEQFYDQFRCGILHQAEITSNSLMKIGSKVPLVMRTQDGQGLVINRAKFHLHLVKVFRDYVRDLIAGTDRELRDNFRTKMDFIARSRSI